MLYPDLTVEEWCQKYPALRGSLRCLCGAVKAISRPWITKDLVGVETDKCAECQRPSSFKYVYRSQERNQRMLNLLG